MPVGDHGAGQVAPEPYFWSVADVSETEALHERLSSVSHIAAFNHVASHSYDQSGGVPVFLAVVGVADHSIYEIGVDSQGGISPTTATAAGSLVTVLHAG